jgi:hypothetical protein
VQEEFCRLIKVIECEPLSGLQAPPFQKQLAGLVIRGLAQNPNSELESTSGYPDFANPDLFDQPPIRDSPSHTSSAKVRLNCVAY